MKLLTFSFGDLMTNTYFCIDESTKECFIIDPGTDGEAVYNKAAERGLNVSHIILTHGHFDHALGVKALKDKTGATVVIGAADAEMLTDKAKNSACIFYPSDFSYPAVEPDCLICEGDTLSLGSTVFSVIETPGHTKGGICLDTGEILFTGDTL
ncbi:MAG: MBL fold metallo-hydrolase, partial [Clostridia bacterium]|nr:MBL fold metallo-hydrolase [Clostridia bacterium]